MPRNRLENALWRTCTLPQIVDQVARDDPDYVFGSWPVDLTSYSAGVRHITYAQLANIVNGLSWWLVQQLGSDREGEVLAYVGPNDVRFMALVIAAIKTGHRFFSTSPRNSPIAHRKLLGSLKCENLITTDPTQPLVRPILEAVESCQTRIIPSIDDLLLTVHPQYTMKKGLDKSLWDTKFIIHTSGSTSIPKPLIWTQETARRHAEASSRYPSDGLSSIDSSFHGKRVLSTLPPFHGAGLLQFILYAICFGNKPVIPATTGAIVTAEGVVNALKQTPADVAVMVPSVVADLAQNPELLDYCAKNLELILYIGGDLPKAVGDRVASKVPLRCWWGASEVGMPQQVIVPELQSYESGWRYVRFHPCAGAIFDKVNDNLYELVIARDETHIDTQTTFTIGGFENHTEYRTRDLFEPHPEVPDAWCWRARADDIIVFLNGEKTNPISMEQHIVARNPGLISGAIVIGAQKFEAALIIDPIISNGPLTTAEQASLIERVWPSVEEANRSTPAHARIAKSMILVAPKPLIRAGKGTIQRAASISQYTADIEKLYADTDVSSYVYGEGDEATSTQIIEATDFNTVLRMIRDTVRVMEGLSEVGDDTSFFDSGMDSLRALQLVRTVRKALRRPNLALSTIYQNPTARQLATAVLSDSTSGSDDQKVLEQLLAIHRDLLQQIPKPTDAPSKKEEGPVDVLLTGSTGTLGTSILHSLLHNTGVGHIFCLNRGEDGGRAAQIERFIAANLKTDILDSRVTFLQADLTDPKLGLDEETYAALRVRVRLLIHNAWPVNFNLTLLAFRPLLVGIVNLFKFVASAAPGTVRTFFVSSISAVTGMGSTAPEEVVPDDSQPLATPLANGYARSKRLAELLCDSAARQLRVPVTILRIGQVAGSTAQRGAVWNRAEWFPSIIISSLLRLRSLPDNLGPLFSEVDWVPSDLLGAVVTDLVLTVPGTTNGNGAEVFNVRNPNIVSWTSLIPTIVQTAKTKFGQDIQVVPSTTWLTQLEESADKDGNEADINVAMAFVAKNPAMKLVDFYRGDLWPRVTDNTPLHLPMVITRAVAASNTLRNMTPIGPEWMGKWVEEWTGDVTAITTESL
ncbi:putative NRPS-like enzyme [Xylaria nigripes]|nr:putative NRPS-like enzyme [Xylaria nigripes]